MVSATVALTMVRPEPGGRVILEPPQATVDAAQRPVAVQEPPLPDASGSPGPLAPSGDPPAAGPAGAAGGAAPPVRNPPPASTRAPAPPAPAPRYAAVAGEGCPPGAGSGYGNRGWFKDWYAVDHGGWAGDGCTGRMIAVPMSGDAGRDDPDNVVVWWFRTPAKASCAVSVHVPGTGRPMDAAGAPAVYFVYGNVGATGTAIGRFEVDQVHNQGRWTAAGSYPTPTGELSIRLVTRGIDWGPGRAGAHLGVSAVRVTC
jgi:hypothetical protein